MKNKRISSKDVARESGVSQATVSYVLNNNPHVKIKPETRQNVLETAKRLNYHVNYIARNMRLRKSASVGIVANMDMSSYAFMKALEGIKDSLTENNYSPTICFGTYDDIRDAEFIKYYYSNLIDGLIFVFCELGKIDIEFLNDNEIPYVLLNANTTKDSSSQIKTDITKACTEAVSHLKSKGLTTIGYLGQQAGIKGSMRFEAYNNSMILNKIKLERQYIHKINADESFLELQLEYEIDLQNLPNAYICDNVNIGFYTLRYLQKNNINVPNDVSIIVLGTHEFSKRIYPTLSAIEAPLYKIGNRGAKMFFEVLQHGINQGDDNIVLEWEFNKRESCL